MQCDGAVLAVALGGAALCGEASQAQEAFRPAPADRVYQVLLLGNTGAAGSDQLAATLTLLASQLAAAGPNSAVVFLGDLLPCWCIEVRRESVAGPTRHVASSRGNSPERWSSVSVVNGMRLEEPIGPKSHTSVVF